MYANIAKNSFMYVVNALGIPATYRKVAPPAVETQITVGFSSVGKDDQEIINAYGINAKVITIKATDGIIPAKFDKIMVKGEVYVGEGHMPIHAGDEIIGYKIYARGQ